MSFRNFFGWRRGPHVFQGVDLSGAAWGARALAAVGSIDSTRAISLRFALDRFRGARATSDRLIHYNSVLQDILEVEAAIRLAGNGPLTIAVGTGEIFRYFDAVRRQLEGATADVLIVDRYLTPDFVSDYLPQIKPGVAVRLLTRDGVKQMVPAVRLYASQHGANVALRSSASFHDRFLLVDGSRAFFSGASFKDGGKLSPTVFAEVTDAFGPLRDVYEAMWAAGTVPPP